MEIRTLENENEFILRLKNRFTANMQRHSTLSWEVVQTAISKHHLSILWMMEETGGEPDVVTLQSNPSIITFIDCSKETPAARRSCCYDDEALEKRKEHKPKFSAMGLAEKIGIELLDFEEYQQLQAAVPVDLKTSSWVQTPAEIRTLGGALFGDRRYNTVFCYHNGAESYYAARGFRGKLII